MSSERLEVVSRHLTSGKMASRPPITAHVLDTTKGKPAANIQLQLFQKAPDGKWTLLDSGKTDGNGRCESLKGSHPLKRGIFKMYFDTEAYFKGTNQASFYPYVEIVFEVSSPSEHYHIPLLLSPFGYTTYRGS